MRRWAPLVVLAAAVVLVGVLAGSPEAGGPTVDGRGPGGLRALYRVLEARGGDVGRWEAPPEGLPAGATFVVAGPTRRLFTREHAEAVVAWIAGGGHLVLAPDGGGGDGERALVEALGLARADERVDPPLGWSAWRAWTTLRERRERASGEVLRARDDRRAPLCPADADVLYTRGDGEPRICAWTRGRGRVTLVNDASVFTNARLGEGDHLAFAVGLLGEGRVLFDEWHQGAGGAVAARDLGPAPEALAAHAVALYALAVWTVARPFGRRLAGADAPRPASTRELLALAELHRRGGHAYDAGVKLLRIARARLARRGEDPKALPEGFAGGERQLVEVAARVGQLQQEKRL
ncbi:MAG: DUF4350 domain-containing protein [Myxococcota bacterium]